VCQCYGFDVCRVSYFIFFYLLYKGISFPFCISGARYEDDLALGFDCERWVIFGKERYSFRFF